MFALTGNSMGTIYEKPKPSQLVVTVPENTTIDLMKSRPREHVPSRSIERVVRIEENKCIMSDADIKLIALVTMAEAEGECEKGKRLVIDTILNRVDSKHFPDTVKGVIYQPHQFSSMWNGRVDRCEVREDICNLVREELNFRTNHDVVFFMAGRYSVYGTPMFQVENHYFSSYY
jgi:N-acetylmuramoyl-L-alanine amidase